MIYNLIAYFIVIIAIGYALFRGYKFFSDAGQGIYCKSCKSCIDYKSLKKFL